MEYPRRDGTTGWIAKITLLSWSYAPTNRPKEESTNPMVENADGSNTEGDFLPAEDCGENGLPFN